MMKNRYFQSINPGGLFIYLCAIFPRHNDRTVFNTEALNRNYIKAEQNEKKNSRNITRRQKLKRKKKQIPHNKN